MLWLWRAARRLRERGVLGMNQRNAEFILDHNPRRLYPLVDDKLRMQVLCQRIGVPTPAIYAALRSYSELHSLPRLLQHHQDFVLKPACGSAGRGVLVIGGRNGPDFLKHDSSPLAPEQLRQHVSDILSGMYSLGGHPDAAIVQQRVILHPAFAPLSYKGIPDVRVILYKNEPAMAMLRLPTKASGGRANLHQGGIGVGIDLETGVTHHAVLHDRAVSNHPDTKAPVVGLRVPRWQEVLTMSRRAAAAVGLGYVGIDIVLDAQDGPLLLEANARPGLAIQIANHQGLAGKLQAIDAALASPTQDQRLCA